MTQPASVRDGEGDDDEVSSFGAYDHDRGGYAADADPYSQAGVSASSHRAQLAMAVAAMVVDTLIMVVKAMAAASTVVDTMTGAKGTAASAMMPMVPWRWQRLWCCLAGITAAAVEGDTKPATLERVAKDMRAVRDTATAAGSSVSAGGQTMSEREILALVEARNNAKMARDFDEADRLRDQRFMALPLMTRLRLGLQPTVARRNRRWRRLCSRRPQARDGSMSWENTIYVAGLPLE